MQVSGGLNAFGPIDAGQRKAHWESLRINNVPRFLFRAFHAGSGGGYPFTVNNTTEIIPHGFMNGRQGHKFYDMAERDIFSMVYNHAYGNKYTLTEFSSWASSLHLVLCYAQSMPADNNVHVAVIDRQKLEGEVLIWNDIHLLGWGEAEYLAHGCIKGRGYTAVPFKKLVECGLYDVFPELQALPWKRHQFGDGLRGEMFCQAPVDIQPAEVTVVRNMAALFGDLALPVAIPLLCLRPRQIMTNNEELQTEAAYGIMRSLGIENIDPRLGSESWLRPGAVYTVRERYSSTLPDGRIWHHWQFPDVRLWIGLLNLLCKHQPHHKIIQELRPNASAVIAETQEAGRTRYDLRPRPQPQPCGEPERRAGIDRYDLRPRN